MKWIVQSDPAKLSVATDRRSIEFLPGGVDAEGRFVGFSAILPPDDEDARKVIDFLPQPTTQVRSDDGLQVFWLLDEPRHVDDRNRDAASSFAARFQRALGRRTAERGCQVGAIRPVHLPDASGPRYDIDDIDDLVEAALNARDNNAATPAAVHDQDRSSAAATRLQEAAAVYERWLPTFDVDGLYAVAATSQATSRPTVRVCRWQTCRHR